MPKKKFEVGDAIKASRGTTDMLLRFLEYKTEEQVTAMEMHDRLMKFIKVIDYHLFEDRYSRPNNVTIGNIDDYHCRNNDKSFQSRLVKLEREEKESELATIRRFEDLEREVTQIAAKVCKAEKEKNESE